MKIATRGRTPPRGLYCFQPAPRPPQSRTRAASLILAGIVAAVTGIARAQSSLPPGVSIQASIQPETATIGDPLRLEITVTSPSGYTLAPPAVGGQVGEFTVLESSGAPPRSESVSAGLVHRSFLVLAVYRTGEVELPPIPLKIRAPDGREIEGSTPALRVRVGSVLGEGDASLRDLKPQAEIADPYAWLWWAVPSVLLALFAAGAWWWWRRRRSRSDAGQVPAARADALDLAESELKALLRRGLLESGEVKTFYVTLSEVVRRVLEAGWGISTQEKTTSEILDGLRQSSPSAAGDGNLGLVRAFLEGCDLVKFAKYIPSKSENEGAVSNAFELLEIAREIRDGRSRTPGPDPQSPGAPGQTL